MMQEILDLLVTDSPSSHDESTASTTVDRGLDCSSTPDGIRREFAPDSMQTSGYSGDFLNEEMKEIVEFLGTDVAVGAPGSRSQIIEESTFVNDRLSPQDGLRVLPKAEESAVGAAPHR